MSTFLWADEQRRQSALFVEISRDAAPVAKNKLPALLALM